MNNQTEARHPYNCICGAREVDIFDILRYYKCPQCSLLWDREQLNYIFPYETQETEWYE